MQATIFLEAPTGRGVGTAGRSKLRSLGDLVGVLDQPAEQTLLPLPLPKMQPGFKLASRVCLGRCSSWAVPSSV